VNSESVILTGKRSAQDGWFLFDGEFTPMFLAQRPLWGKMHIQR